MSAIFGRHKILVLLGKRNKPFWYDLYARFLFTAWLALINCSVPTAHSLMKEPLLELIWCPTWNLFDAQLLSLPLHKGKRSCAHIFSLAPQPDDTTAGDYYLCACTFCWDNRHIFIHSPEHTQMETVEKEQRKISIRNISYIWMEVFPRFGLKGRRITF